MKKGKFYDGTPFIKNDNIHISFNKYYGTIEIYDDNINFPIGESFTSLLAIIDYLNISYRFYIEMLKQLGAVKKINSGDVPFIENVEVWEKVVDWVFSVITINKLVR